MPREIFRGGRGVAGMYNQSVRQQTQRTIDEIDVVLPGDKIEEPRRANNTISLAPGSHGGAELQATNTQVSSIGAGATFNRRVVVGADAIFDGVTFSTTRKATSQDDCVTVRSPARVVFRGCTFIRPGDSTSSFVYVADGAKVVMVGCVFTGSGTTSSKVVAHPSGTATDVQVAFCYNATGNTLGDAGDITMTGNI